MAAACRLARSVPRRSVLGRVIHHITPEADIASIDDARDANPLATA